MALQVAEATGKGTVLLVGKILVSYEQDLVFEKQILDLAKHVVVGDGLFQVDVLQFGAQGAVQHLGFHRLSPLVVWLLRHEFVLGALDAGGRVFQLCADFVVAACAAFMSAMRLRIAGRRSSP